MSLVGCFFTPHPPIIVPGVGQPSDLALVDGTVKAMRSLGEIAARLDPDTIVLMSPHAPLARDEMGVSPAPSYQGSFMHFRAPQVRLEAPGDLELVQRIINHSSSQGVPASLLRVDGETMELDHGAMVPLYYVTSGLQRAWRLVLLSFSYLDMDAHARFGTALGRAMESSSSRVLYVASGDLSHRLLPGAPAGYDPRGAEFDQAVVDAFSAGDWGSLLALDPALLRAAGECGYRSLAVLSGVVGVVEAAGRKTKNRVLSYEWPFGVCYLVGEVEMAQLASERKAGS